MIKYLISFLMVLVAVGCKSQNLLPVYYLLADEPDRQFLVVKDSVLEFMDLDSYLSDTLDIHGANNRVNIFIEAITPKTDETTDLQTIINNAGKDLVMHFPQDTFQFHGLEISNKESVTLIFDNTVLQYPNGTYGTITSNGHDEMLLFTNCDRVEIRGGVTIDGRFGDAGVTWNRHTTATEGLHSWQIDIDSTTDRLSNRFVDAERVNFRRLPLTGLYIKHTDWNYGHGYDRISIRNITARNTAGVAWVRGNHRYVEIKGVDAIVDTIGRWHYSAGQKQVTFTQEVSVSDPLTHVSISDCNFTYGHTELLFLQNYLSAHVTNISADYYGYYPTDTTPHAYYTNTAPTPPTGAKEFNGGSVFKSDNVYFSENRNLSISNFSTTNTSRVGHSGVTQYDSTTLAYFNSITLDDGNQDVLISNFAVDGNIKTNSSPVAGFGWSQRNVVTNGVMKGYAILNTGRQSVIRNVKFSNYTPKASGRQVDDIDSLYVSGSYGQNGVYINGKADVHDCTFWERGVYIVADSDVLMKGNRMYGNSRLNIERAAEGTDSTKVHITDHKGGELYLGYRTPGLGTLDATTDIVMINVDMEFYESGATWKGYEIVRDYGYLQNVIERADDGSIINKGVFVDMDSIYSGTGLIGDPYILDGDEVAITYTPTNYTPATTAEANNLDHLTAHLKGIDDGIGAVSADGVATGGTYDGANDEIDVTVAAPGSNFSIDVSALAEDADVPTQLTDLSDVNTSTPTNRNVLVADGVDFESRALVEADISDLQAYLTTEVDGSTANELQDIDQLDLSNDSLRISLTQDADVAKVDLSSLKDGTGTDDQNLSFGTKSGSTVPLNIQDGVGVSLVEGTNVTITRDASNQITLSSSGGGATQLTDLSDVNTSTPTNRNVLVADGVDWESRALVEADISDLQTYLTAEVDGSVSNEGSLTVGAGTASTSLIQSNTSGSTDVTLTAGTNMAISEAGNVITLDATDTDTQLSEEQVEDFVGGMVVGNTETLVSVTYQDVDGTIDFEVEPNLSNYTNDVGFLTAEVDGSITNEGDLTVLAGTASTSIISSNTSGSTDVTLTAGTNMSISEVGNVITLDATGDGTGTDDQNLSFGTKSGSTVPLNIQDGIGVNLVEGTNVTITRDASNQITFSSSGGASQLSDLTDVNTSTPTNRNVLVADGVDFESRALVEADISDLQAYILPSDTAAMLSPYLKTELWDDEGGGDISYSSGGVKIGASGTTTHGLEVSTNDVYLGTGVDLLKQTEVSTWGTIFNPDRGYITGATGALQIKLPPYYPDDYVQIKLSIYEYGAQKGYELILSGYFHTSLWLNCNAIILGEGHRNWMKVRFGDDGTNGMIWLGETTDTWNNTRIQIEEIKLNQGTLTDWVGDYPMSFVTSFVTVKVTENAQLVSTGVYKDGAIDGAIPVVDSANFTSTFYSSLAYDSGIPSLRSPAIEKYSWASNTKYRLNNSGLSMVKKDGATGAFAHSYGQVDTEIGGNKSGVFGVAGSDTTASYFYFNPDNEGGGVGNNSEYFRLYGDEIRMDTSTLVIDTDLDRVGIGDATPDYALDVDVDAHFNGRFHVNGEWGNNNQMLVPSATVQKLDYVDRLDDNTFCKVINKTTDHDWCSTAGTWTTMDNMDSLSFSLGLETFTISGDTSVVIPVDGYYTLSVSGNLYSSDSTSIYWGWWVDDGVAAPSELGSTNGVSITEGTTVGFSNVATFPLDASDEIYIRTYTQGSATPVVNIDANYSLTVEVTMRRRGN